MLKLKLGGVTRGQDTRKGLGEFDQRRFSKVRLRDVAFIVFIILFLWDQAKRD